jgi:voltage-gated potassium channel
LLAKLLSIAFLAKDGGAWIKKNPLAVTVMVLTPPVAPAAMQGIRVLRLFRLLRLARGWQYINRVFTPEGLPFLVGIGAVLVFVASVLFTTVETHAHTHVSLANGIWWAIGVVSTEGSSIDASTTAEHIITVALMVLGICLFSLITAGLTQRFVGHKQAKQPSAREQAILEELQRLRARLELLECHRDGLTSYAER